MHDQGRAHTPFTTGRAFGDVDAGEPEQSFLPRLGLLLYLVLIGTGEKFPASVEFFSAAPVAQQTVMPDFDEPVGQNMEEEPPDKLVGIHRHDLLFVVVGVVPPPEGHLPPFFRDTSTAGKLRHPHDPDPPRPCGRADHDDLHPLRAEQDAQGSEKPAGFLEHTI